jgi:hypothetical protein
MIGIEIATDIMVRTDSITDGINATTGGCDSERLAGRGGRLECINRSARES